jgi:hypothetical protein
LQALGAQTAGLAVGAARAIVTSVGEGGARQKFFSRGAFKPIVFFVILEALHGNRLASARQTLRGNDRLDADGLQMEKAFFEGALTVYPHLAPRTSGGCVCKEARFDLDEYGRLYVPDVHDFCIRVYDNAANLICRLGYYGNADAAGPGSRVPAPEIPLGWPMTCGINRAGRLYIGDVLNQRIVRVDLGAAAEVNLAAE